MDKISSEEEDIASASDLKDSPTSPAKDNALFKPKPQPKIIRVLTVLAYILSVSMAAILLSIYYIFMWDERLHTGARRAVQEQSFYEMPHAIVLTTITNEENATIRNEEEEEPFEAMQQQVRDSIGANDMLIASSTAPPATTTEFNASAGSFSNESILMKKIMSNQDAYAEND